MSEVKEPQDFDSLELGRVRNKEESSRKIREKEKLATERVEAFGEQLKEQAIKRSPHDVSWFMKQLHRDIGFYFRFFWDMELSPKQFIMCDSYVHNRHTVGIFSRQTGKTTGGAGSCNRDMVFEPNTKIGLYAPTQNQSINVGFGALKAFFDAQPILGNMINEFKKSGYILMNNGNEFRAHTANKDSNIRGFSPSVIWIDESQDVNDETYNADILASGSAVKGMTASGRGQMKKTKILETGTPKGRNHFFKTVRAIPIIYPAVLRNAKIVRQGFVTPTVKAESGAIVVWQPWWESPIIKADLEWLDGRRQAMSKRLFDQEYCCAFNSSEGFAFNYEHVLRAATIANRSKDWKWDHRDIYCAGVDLGRNQDHTVLTIFHVDPDTRQRHMVMQQQWNLNEEWRIIFIEMMEILHKWKPKLTLVDKTGIGDPIYEQVFKYCGLQCEPFQYGLTSKNDLMRNTEGVLERNLTTWWDTEELIWQFRDAPMVLMESGHPKYPKPDEGHDDRVQSTVLALQASSIWLGDGNGSRKFAVHVEPNRIEFNEFLEETRNDGKRSKKGRKKTARKTRDEWRAQLYK